MSGMVKWWTSRKSRLGMTPIAIRPPDVKGREWWTTPPIAPPQPEHIEYVMQWSRELEGKPGRHAQALRKYVADWITAARQLLHEQLESDHGDLVTTDGLIIQTNRQVRAMLSRIAHLGGVIEPEWTKLRDALNARAASAKKRRIA